MKTPVTEIQLPTVTVCSKESFRNLDAQTTKIDVLANLSYYTYTWNDFFPVEFLNEIEKWNPHEIFNRKLGVCFSLTYSQNVTKYSKSIHLKKSKKYQVLLYSLWKIERYISFINHNDFLQLYLYETGSEYWMQLSLLQYISSMAEIDATKNLENIKGIKDMCCSDHDSS